jgi:hypothetical protein
MTIAGSIEEAQKQITADIEKLNAEVAQKIAEAEKLTKMQAVFPDLRRTTGRWNKVAYASKSINAKVTDFESRHNCGCCNDSPLEIWPYAMTEHGKVYSDPAEFRVGERNPWRGGDDPYPGWDEKMREAGIPEPIIDRVRGFFRRADLEESESDEL